MRAIVRIPGMGYVPWAAVMPGIAVSFLPLAKADAEPNSRGDPVRQCGGR